MVRRRSLKWKWSRSKARGEAWQRGEPGQRLQAVAAVAQEAAQLTSQPEPATAVAVVAAAGEPVAVGMSRRRVGGD